MLKCRVCKSTGLEKVLSLGNQPLVNSYLTKKSDESPLYPLELMRCTVCSLIQLSYVVPKEKLFPDDYPYIPSVSKTNLEHFESIATQLVEELDLKTNSLVVDVGSNDGSLLKAFKSRGTKVFGIEPANDLAKKATLDGIPTQTGFFNRQMAEGVAFQHGKAKLVTMTNVFAHIDDLHECLEALDALLDEDGVFFAQFPDVRNLLKENQFDTIYHEHLSYFTYEPLYHLFANSPFELYKMESSKLHGGSMKIQVRRRNNPFGSFIFNTQTIASELRTTLASYKAEGKKIVAFGAAAKGMILLNYCKLDNSIIDYVADGTPYKQGKFTPATRIPIVPEEHLLEDPPDIVLILAWNFKDEIMKKLAGRGYTFVVPIPHVQIIDEKRDQ